MRTVAISAGEAFAALFPIVDPLGNTPTFCALTSRWSHQTRVAEARRIALIVGLILLVFMLVGEPLLHFFGISLEALQIAGGIVVAVAGFQMVTGLGEVEDEKDIARTSRANIAFTPMAMPLLAGPAAMGIVLGLDARGASVLRLPGFAIGIAAIAVVVYVCLRMSTHILRVLGKGGIDALTRIFGLLVLAIGIELIVHGIVSHGAVVAATMHG